MGTDFSINLTHHDKIAAGRGLARKAAPYFTAALFSLMPRPMKGMFEKVGAGLAVTPRGIMYYDPDVVEKEWDLEDVTFGWLHEVGHYLRGHAQRCEEYGYDKQLWNQACDAAINDDLVAMKQKPLATDILPSRIVNARTQKPMPDGLTEEAYYDVLRQQPKQDPNTGGGCPRPGHGSCGGVAGNPLDLPDDGMPSSAPSGRSPVEVERVKKAVAEAIKKHEEKHGCGSVPGGWKVWADNELTPPVVRWQDKLRRAVRQGVARVKGMVNYHYERPSRRQWALGYGPGSPILPSMYAPLPRVGAFVDTSGSMGPNDLQIAMSEMQGVLKASGAEVLLGVCDAQMHGKIEPVKDIKAACARLAGGGGTNFVPVFEELAAMPRDKRPHVVVFLTDGDGPAPATPPDGIYVIWVLVGDHAVVPFTNGGQRISWGEQIFVRSPGGEKRR